MTRMELLEAASQHLTNAAVLLTAAGEDRLAGNVERIAEWVDFNGAPFADNVLAGRDQS
jgi:hypothetical protein